MRERSATWPRKMTRPATPRRRASRLRAGTALPSPAIAIRWDASRRARVSIRSSGRFSGERRPAWKSRRASGGASSRRRSSSGSAHSKASRSTPSGASRTGLVPRPVIRLWVVSDAARITSGPERPRPWICRSTPRTGTRAIVGSPVAPISRSEWTIATTGMPLLPAQRQIARGNDVASWTTTTDGSRSERAATMARAFGIRR
jgi:hypothetical protein